MSTFGDAAAAAAAVHIHPNTFRYRLKRLAVVAGIDLSDPESDAATAAEPAVPLTPPPTAAMTRGSARPRVGGMMKEFPEQRAAPTPACPRVCVTECRRWDRCHASQG
ncbi:helix-turn-helix domain-containing protein [Streptomyces sp. NBC_00057]